MKRIGALIGLAVLCGAVAVRADEKMKKGEHKAHMAKAVAGNSLTGCLQKGDEANTFWLTNATGGPAGVDKFELIGAPASLKMSEHIGHKIEVRGHAVGAGEAEKIEHGKMKGMAKKEEKKEEQGEHHFKVASMKHIAPTCP